MMIFLYTFSGFIIFFLLLAVGYIIQHKMIHGSCGGLANAGVECACTCESPCIKRRIKNKFAQLTGREVEDHHHNEGETDATTK